MEVSQIREFYTGKNVFITGGTGFLGKAIIAKLLRSCPELGKIFVLIRAKKGSEGKARLENLLQGPLFDSVKADHPEFSKKLHPIRGDIAFPGLGICEEDVVILRDQVNIIIHSAATVRFDEPIKQALKINVTGTKGVIDLAKTVKHLESVVHVSTAYSNCELPEIDEKLYPINMDPEAAIQAFETMSDELALQITAKCVDKKPNTYTYTKHLAEKLVVQHAHEIPVCIVRPSIVVATYDDPFPGWIDNLYGPTGIFLAGAKGVLRTILADFDKRLDVIPLDCVVNLMLAATWKTAMENKRTESTGSREPVIYNCCSGKENPFYLSKTVPMALKAFHDYPFNEILWYPTYYMTKNPIVYFFLELFLHFIPSFLLDVKAKMCGEKPFMMYIQRKIKNGVVALRYFCMREFDFSTENTKALYNELNPKDKQTFWFDINSVNWNVFMRNYIYGIRKHILKEEDKDLEKARQNLKKMYLLHRVVILAVSILSVIFFSYVFTRALGVM